MAVFDVRNESFGLILRFTISNSHVHNNEYICTPYSYQWVHKYTLFISMDTYVHHVQINGYIHPVHINEYICTPYSYQWVHTYTLFISMDTYVHPVYINEYIRTPCSNQRVHTYTLFISMNTYIHPVHINGYICTSCLSCTHAGLVLRWWCNS